MSLNSLPVSQRNVILRTSFRAGMAHDGAKATGLAGGGLQEEDLESLIPLETQASTSSRDSASRDALLRENHALQKLSAANQRER